ncbi:hypothetical protein GCM10009557_53170 [Virgisporangium ochraceum]
MKAWIAHEKGPGLIGDVPPGSTVELLEKLPAVRVVQLMPLTGATRGLVDAAFLAALPDGALLVNAARVPSWSPTTWWRSARAGGSTPRST